MKCSHYTFKGMVSFKTFIFCGSFLIGLSEGSSEAKLKDLETKKTGYILKVNTKSIRVKINS